MRYGWKPDVPDRRDYKYRETFGEESALTPRSVWPVCLRFRTGADLRRGHYWPEMFDQGELGSCVENAWVAAMAYVLGQSGAPLGSRVLSRLFLYFNVRGGLPEDTGSSIRDGIKSVAKDGDCVETLWPYDLSYWRVRPSPRAYEEASLRRKVRYARLSTLEDMLHCLTVGFPFVFGIAVYDSFFDIELSSDVCPMPGKGEQMLGGHALCAVGFSPERRCFLVRNSWGPSWGREGFFWLPYDYATDRNLSDDFWTCRSVPVA